MKSILKTGRRTSSELQVETSSQSHSIGGVRWTPMDKVKQPHSSAPTRPLSTNSRDKHRSQKQQQHRQNGLRELRSLQECVQFIQHWKEQVDQVCQLGGEELAEGNKGSGCRTERSLEESRKLILHWASELNHVNKLLTDTTQISDQEKWDVEPKEEAQARIMEWAKELQLATENCGVSSEELGRMLRLLGLKKKRLVNLMPLLEFITWSLLKEDNMRMIPQLWLLAKQRSWKAGIPRYIPNSVWSWISSAAADVLLDPKTNHPWLTVSEDQRMVQEGLSPSDVPEGLQRFDSWPCVLGWEGYGYGRHYWEVDIVNDGYWRVGVTSANSKRHGRFPMTPQQGYWVLWRSTTQFYACTKPESPLPMGLVPRRMGIYLDYEEGQISFYNADTKSHIYTFTASFKGKLYPLFAPLDGRTLMTVVPP